MISVSPFDASTTYIQQCFHPRIDVAVVLGSGLAGVADILPDAIKLPYDDIPGFPETTVPGHNGLLHLGTLPNGLNVAMMQGRFHAYEGHPMEKVVYPLRVLHLLGAETVILSNAAGGINPSFKGGDIMLIEDHINLTGNNPLVGPNLDELGPRFPDLSEVYDLRLRELAFRVAQEMGLPLQKGIYCGVTGPCYETPAEIRLMRTLGGDAVGMSTVPEAIAAAHMGMRTLGFSCISNPAAGVIAGQYLSHEDVLAMVEQSKEQFSELISRILLALPTVLNDSENA